MSNYKIKKDRLEDNLNHKEERNLNRDLMEKNEEDILVNSIEKQNTQKLKNKSAVHLDKKFTNDLDNEYEIENKDFFTDFMINKNINKSVDIQNKQEKNLLKEKINKDKNDSILIAMNKNQLDIILYDNNFENNNSSIMDLVLLKIEQKNKLKNKNKDQGN